jgi:hypothetical protein
MVTLLRFFIIYAPLVYLTLAVGALFAIRSLLRRLRERRDAIFGLEQEMAQRRMARSITALALIFLVALGELILEAFLVPSLPAITVLSTPTLNLLAVQTNTLSPVMAAIQGSATPLVLPTAAASGCIPGQIMITFPKPGDQVSGDVVLTGTADIPDFGFYKYEVALVGNENWSTILADRKAVRDGELGHWDTTQLTPGDYLLRLVVSDNQGNYLPSCIVPVRIVGR